ncbi:MAG TPA: type II secretion system protein GspJ [Polyangia bacterium]|nr:type II secretion system protein GspJ [Polyangia bacterium]
MRRRDAAFTLLEIMLAITIMGFMTALLWGSFSRTAQIKQRTEAGQDRVHAARVALMRISREIEMAYMSNSYNIGLQERRTMFIGAPHADFDELRFSWFGHQRLRADSAESDTAVVMYYTEPDPIDRRAINLVRRETRRLEQKDPKSIPGEAYILCPGVTRLKFQYYDYKNKQWKEEWSTLGADGLPYLPTHVRVTLELLDERGGKMTFSSAARIQMTEPVDYRPNKQ